MIAARLGHGGGLPVSDLVLVTGASGFLGKHLVKDALARGYRVRGAVRRPEAEKEVRAAIGDAGERLEFIRADLMSDDGWDAAVRDCRYVVHTGTLVTLAHPRDPDAFVPVARDGTPRVLRVAAKAGVERAVLTSACLAIWGGQRPDANRIWTEADWTNTESRDVLPYPRSKTIAERAAWQFIESEGSGMSLAVMNPSTIFGPPLDADVSISGNAIRLMLQGKYPLAPHWGSEMVDVRDVSEAHLTAMESKAAGGERFICSGGALTLIEVARLLAEELPRYRSKLPKITMPNALTRVLSHFDDGLRSIVADLGPIKHVSNAKAASVLNMRFRPAQDAVTAMATALVSFGAI
jgi:dihydroflavonol-4-reductase